MKKKRLLVLTPRFPYPVLGGDKLRILNQCLELSKHFEITLLSLCDSKSDLSCSFPDSYIFKDVHKVFLPKYISFGNCLISLFTNQPLQNAYYKSKKFQTLAIELSKRNDLLLCHLIRTADYADSISIPKILEMTDAISLNYERSSKIKGWRSIKKLIYKIESTRVNIYEREILSKFDICSLISATDRDFLINSNNSNNIVINGNGVDFDFEFKNIYSESLQEKKIIFIGNMNTLPNFDAAVWFASEVMPQLPTIHRFTFHIIGTITADRKKTLEKYNSVVVTGKVDSISEASKNAMLSVCPIRVGAGVQNKVLQYMSMGIPCVTTNIGIEGIAAKHGKDVLIADTKQEFVEKIVLLATNANVRNDISSSARVNIESHYSWSAQLAPLVDSMKNLI